MVGDWGFPALSQNTSSDTISPFNSSHLCPGVTKLYCKTGLKSSGNAVPTRKFDVLVVGTYVPTRRKGLAKFTGALTTNDLSILGLFTKQQTVVSVANSLTFQFKDQTLHFLF